MDELHAKTPQLSTILYHGPGRNKFTAALLASTDVVVTTYDIMSSEHEMSPSGPLFRVRWHRFVQCSAETDSLYLLDCWTACEVCCAADTTALAVVGSQVAHSVLLCMTVGASMLKCLHI